MVSVFRLTQSIFYTVSKVFRHSVHVYIFIGVYICKLDITNIKKIAERKEQTLYAKTQEFHFPY